jgi:hypothetical protein
MPNIEYDFGHIRFPLTRREAKGYCLELDIQNMLSSLGYYYYANPVSPVTWKSDNIKRKVDIELYNGIKIECKDIDGKVFRSWYIRDWKSKGSCVFVYRGDLKLSPSIQELYHPVVFHYFLLPIYLNYELPLFRGVTRLFEPISTKNVESKENPAKTFQLNSSNEKVRAKTCELSTICGVVLEPTRNRMKDALEAISCSLDSSLESNNSSLYEAVRYRYEATRYKDDKSAELQVCSKKVEDQRCSFRDRLRWKIREVLENLKYRISRFLNSSIDGKPEPKHPETRTFHYKGWETCTVS